MKIGTLVRIHWVDSSESRGWVSPEHASKDPGLKCESVGWLIAENEKFKTISGHRSLSVGGESEAYCSTMTIPTCAIRKMSKIQ